MKVIIVDGSAMIFSVAPLIVIVLTMYGLAALGFVRFWLKR